MKVKLLLLLVAIALVVLPTAVVAKSPTVTPYPIIVRSEEDIEVCVGKRFIIDFETNPSTGYTYSFHYDKRRLRLVKQWVVMPEYPECTIECIGNICMRSCPPPPVGQGYTVYLKFKALRRGDTRIVVRHYRPWKGNPVYLEMYNVHINRCRG